MAGCPQPPSPTSPLVLRSYAKGLIYQYCLQAQKEGTLSVPSSNRLVAAFASAGGDTPFQLRTQSLSGPPEVRFTDSARRVYEQPAVSTRRTQAAATTETFIINTGNSEPSGDVSRRADLRLTSANAYFYVDSTPPDADHPSLTINDADLQGLSAAFDKIYPTLTQNLGADPGEGIDGEKRLFIVISPAVDNWGKEKGLLGYFWSRDALPRPNSNQKEVIFLSDKIFTYPTYTQYGTLAHEFTHLIVFNQKTRLRGAIEDTWLNEGWAMLGMDLCGYGLLNGNEDVAREIVPFLKEPHKYSLTDWANNPRGFSYGLSYLFCRYLYDLYKPLVKSAIASSFAGIPNLDEQLTAYSSNFLSVFTDWLSANYVSRTGLTDDPRFNYSVNLRGRYGSIQLPGITPLSEGTPLTSGTLRAWSGVYYSFDTRRDWKFPLTAGMAPLVGTAIRFD